MYFKGGIQRYSRYQYSALKEIYGENNVYLYSLKSRDPSTSFENEISVSYSEPLNGILGKIRYFMCVMRAIVVLKPDLIVINHINLAPIGLLAKILLKKQYTLNVYGLEIWSGLNKIKCIALLKADRIIGDCKFILSYISSNYGIDGRRLKLLYDPVDTDVFRPLNVNKETVSKYKLPLGKFVLMTVGRLDRFKGHSLVIKVMKELPDEIVYVIVGGGRFDKDLKQLVVSNGLQDRVVFTGRVEESELVDMYNACDIFVLISKFDKNEGEGLPLTPIEASSCEKPIIVGDEDGSIEACDSGVNGYHVSSDDCRALVDNIMILYANSDLKERMGVNGRDKVIKCFGYKVFKNEQKQIIDGLSD